MGSQGSTSNSTPLTGQQRAEAYQYGIGNIFGGGFMGKDDYMRSNPGATEGDYQRYIAAMSNNARDAMPTEYRPLANAGAAKVLTNGDYDKLQADVLRGNTAGLDYAKGMDLRNADNDASKRGIWSSGLVLQMKKDIDNAYSPAYAKAGGDATTQRYALESQDLAAQNARDMQNKAFDADQGKQQYESKWRPADYLAGVWNGTGGVVSSGNSGGWSI